MNTALQFLKEELSRHGQPFEQFFQVKKLEQGILEKNELLDILQYAYTLFTIVEEIEERNPKWQSVTSKQAFEILKAIVSLDAMPDKEMFKEYFPNNLTESETIGYLYLVHQFQFNGYQFGCRLRNMQLFPEGSLGTFNTPISIIKSWDTFIIALNNHQGTLVQRELKKGMEMALSFILPCTVENKRLSVQ